MKTYPPNFGGWLATTFKDPHELLETIWTIARFDYTGLKGWLTENETVLEFSGVRIRIDDDPFQFRDEHKLSLEITDGKEIQPEFFDLWEYLKANHMVHGGPDEEDIKYFNDSGKRWKELEQLDYWLDRFYARPASPRTSATQWLEDEDAPPNITYKAIQRRARERENFGEIIPGRKNQKKDKKTVR